MFIVLLRFTDRKADAAAFMEAHKAWIKRGFDEGVFLLGGSLRPDLGGALFAHATTLAELHTRVDADPFVKEGIVTADILDIAVWRADERLKFLAS